MTDTTPLLPPQSTYLTQDLCVYRRRWYILFLWAVLTFMQGALGNVWVVIALPVEVVFGWTDSDISLMQMWTYITYFVTVLPWVWLMNRYGASLSLSIMYYFSLMKCSICYEIRRSGYINIRDFMLNELRSVYYIHEWFIFVPIL